MIMVYGVFLSSMVTIVTPDLLADHLFTIDFHWPSATLCCFTFNVYPFPLEER